MVVELSREKEALLLGEEEQHWSEASTEKRRRRSNQSRSASKISTTIGVLVTGIVCFGLLKISVPGWRTSSTVGAIVGGCQQFPPLIPPRNHPLDSSREYIFGDYLNTSVGILQGLVRIKAESYDDNGPVGQDPRWDAFFQIAAYLERTFPLLHEKLVLTKINTHALLYTWEGSDPSLKPVVFMAHQDTVPVDPSTYSDWTYPPYSGYFDGTSLWGRGSVDCKDTLSASLEAVELLLAKGFEPTRTVILSFGFDEESNGTDGAGRLSKHIESVYGRDGVEFILDEGGLGVGEMWGIGFAGVATAEKGYMDVIFTLHTPGGHSSIPPDHTSIGIASSLITSLESAPYSPQLSPSSPILTMLQCAATYATSISPEIKANVAEASKSGKKGEVGRQRLAEVYASQGRAERYLVATSQAVDVITGGVKVNALPETTSFTVNYRIDVNSNPQEVKDKITSLLLPIAQKHHLEVEAFGTTFGSPSSTSAAGGLLKVVTHVELAPAPITPTSGSAVWEVLSGTIQHVFVDKYNGTLVVSPCIMGGNGDTAFYWNVTKNIFRFSPSDPVSDELIHTVDEHLLFSDHIRAVWFYHELIRTVDSAAL
ncbi:carboxypeptidase S [Meredithblackwellia eburnea MCA 4105]